MTETRHNPTLRELLDAVRPDSDDLFDAALSDAAEAVDRSIKWRRLFENQLRFDREVSAAMKEIELSDEIKRRLAATLAADRKLSPADVPQPFTKQPPAPRMTRRQWAYAATAAASLVGCIGLGLLLFGNGPATLTLDEIRGHIPLATNGKINVSGLEPFDNSFTLSLPTGRWERVELDDPLGIAWSGSGRHDAALLPFITSGRRPIRGYLLIVPTEAVISPPTTTVLSTSHVSYFPAENTAWTDSNGTIVYICFVEPGKLPTLQRLLYPQSA